MTTILINLAIIGVFVWHHFSMKKIEEEEAQALSPLVLHHFLRNNLGEFISNVHQDTDNYIVFEGLIKLDLEKREPRL